MFNPNNVDGQVTIFDVIMLQQPLFIVNQRPTMVHGLNMFKITIKLMQNSPKIHPARILLGVFVFFFHLFFSIQKFHPSWPTQHFQMAIPRISWRPDWAWNSREVAGFDRPMGDSVRKSRGKSSRLLNWCTRPGKRLQFANWKITMLFMGKLTISTGPFSIAMLVYQRVHHFKRADKSS